MHMNKLLIFLKVILRFWLVGFSWCSFIYNYFCCFYMYEYAKTLFNLVLMVSVCVFEYMMLIKI